jgi:SAM-dependent methyltransferase
VVRSGRAHFEVYGRGEGRKLRVADTGPYSVAALRRVKFERLSPLLRRDLPHRTHNDIADFLSDALRQESGLGDTAAVVSSNEYDGFAWDMIRRLKDGLILDCGAGSRSVYIENVVNFEIAAYPSTDVIGVGEELPFQDNSFDGVLSLAVLEHVKNPFRCAAEIIRVLKPGGELICAVPFLQPEHGYPHHYYNMAPQGLRALFADDLHIDAHRVLRSTHPVWTLNWIIRSWANSLSGGLRESFLDLPLKELLRNPLDLINRPWARDMPEAATFELASATVLFAHKKRKRIED